MSQKATWTRQGAKPILKTGLWIFNFLNITVGWAGPALFAGGRLVAVGKAQRFEVGRSLANRLRTCSFDAHLPQTHLAYVEFSD